MFLLTWLDRLKLTYKNSQEYFARIANSVHSTVSVFVCVPILHIIVVNQVYVLWMFGIFFCFGASWAKGLVPFTQLVKVRRGKLVLALPSIRFS